MHWKSTDHKVLLKNPGQNIKNGWALNPHNKHTVVFLLVADEETRNYMLRLCSEINYDCRIAPDPDELVAAIKKLDNTIVFVDYKAVNIYGARIYSKINVACTGCKVIFLSDKNHKHLIKEAMERGAYACILAPYAEWEVRTMIRNILAKKKLKR